MNACASVSVVASVMFGSAMAMLSTGKESFLNNSNDENVAFSTRIMIARHYSALTQTVVVPGEATANRDAVGVNGLLSTAMGATKGKRASKSSHLLSRSVSLMNGPRVNSSPVCILEAYKRLHCRVCRADTCDNITGSTT